MSFQWVAPAERRKKLHLAGSQQIRVSSNGMRPRFPYEFTCQLATLAPPSPEMQQLLVALQGNQEQTNRFFGVFAQTVSVSEFFAPENMHQIFGGNQQTDT